VTQLNVREPSPDERLAALDKMLNVLVHPDWREVYLFLAADAEAAQQQMDHASGWEAFVAARAVKTYLRERLMALRELVNAEKADIEAAQAAERGPLDPPEYEVD
jgi:hypothetical protein